jgi:hypothetical protein
MYTQSLNQATQKMQVLTVTEPRLEDDVAFHDECDECGNFIHTCICEQEDPDRMHDEMHED